MKVTHKNRKPKKGRAICRACGREVRESDAESVDARERSCLCRICAEAVEAVARKQDTHWEALATAHGVRFHRVGNTLALDVERQADGTWSGAVSTEHRLLGHCLPAATAQQAAGEIEDLAGAERRPLPPEREWPAVEGGGQ